MRWRENIRGGRIGCAGSWLCEEVSNEPYGDIRLQYGKPETWEGWEDFDG